MNYLKRSRKGMKEAAIQIIIIVVLCTTTVGAASCSTVPARPADALPGDYEYTKQYLSWLIQKEMKKFDVTGLSIALVSDQRIVWAEGFGYADKANTIPATSLTIYRAGSIAKLFTTAAVMQLAEQGRIDIDKPLQTYLPQFSVKTRFPASGPIPGFPPTLPRGCGAIIRSPSRMSYRRSKMTTLPFRPITCFPIPISA
jgi:CubicO group peptidase (beta-lactamase class C family)